jgi:hypothetical protein
MELLLAVALIGLLLGGEMLQEKKSPKPVLMIFPPWFRWLVYQFIILAILFAGTFRQAEFIYFSF